MPYLPHGAEIFALAQNSEGETKLLRGGRYENEGGVHNGHAVLARFTGMR